MSIASTRSPRALSAPVFALILTLSVPPLWMAARAVVDSAGATGSDQGLGAVPGLAPPDGVSAVAGGDRVSLAWTPVPGASGYVVYAGTRAGAENDIVAVSVDGKARGLTIPGLTQGTIHYFRVRAIRGHSTGAASVEVHAPALNSPWQELLHSNG